MPPAELTLAESQDPMQAEQLLYLSQADVTAAGVTMAEIIDALEAAFREKGAGRVEVPPKLDIHPGEGDNFIHAMPACIPALDAAGIKWVSGFPDNPRCGLPYISGLLILNDPATGLPLAVMDCIWITAMRTAAASALSARHLARPDASVVGVLGCGVQARTHAEALSALFPVERIRAYDIHPERAQRYAEEVAGRFDLAAEAVATPRQAVSGCDIVVTAGPILKTPHATIQPGWLDEGAFASMVDFDSYWHRDALAEAGKFCTDDRAQLRHFQELQYFQDIPPVHADLGELVTASKPGRQSPEERTLAANLGSALADMAVAPLIYERARRQGLGVRLAL